MQTHNIETSDMKPYAVTALDEDLLIVVQHSHIVEFAHEFIEAIIGIFGKAYAVEAGSKSAGSGDDAFGEFACKKGAGSVETDSGGEGSSNESEIRGVAGLAEAFLGNALFDFDVGDLTIV